jgi:flagellar export protein FliJ
MKSGPALKKLAKHRIEILQRALNRADADAGVAQSKQLEVEAELQRERILAAESGDGADFARYAAAIAPKRAALAEATRKAAAHAHVLRAELLEAFAEGKKIDILLERAAARERAEDERIEQAQLDEVALRVKA